jgi:hypothetical protein
MPTITYPTAKQVQTLCDLIEQSDDILTPDELLLQTVLMDLENELFFAQLPALWVARMIEYAREWLKDRAE